MPSSRQVRMTRQAISPRLAIRILLKSIVLPGWGGQGGGGEDEVASVGAGAQ
jgi:hypothetical protein